MILEGERLGRGGGYHHFHARTPRAKHAMAGQREALEKPWLGGRVAGRRRTTRSWPVGSRRTCEAVGGGQDWGPPPTAHPKPFLDFGAELLFPGPFFLIKCFLLEN